MRRLVILASLVLGIGLSVSFTMVILAATTVDLKPVLVNWTKVVSNGGNDYNADGKVNGLDFSEVVAGLSGGGTVTPTPTAPSGNVKVLCENKTYDGWSNSPIELGGNADDTNGNIMKVIRNCKFLNTADGSILKPAILVRKVDNLLIENSTFDNIRTHIVGSDVRAIKFGNQGASEVIKNVVIRNNKFDRIGAGAVAIGDTSPKTSNIIIEGNEIIGHDDVGEQGIAIKSCDGPIWLRNNDIHGYRPCNGTQDCSNGIGNSIVIKLGGHLGSLTSPPKNVTVEGNYIHDNTIGITVSAGINIVLRNNRYANNGRDCNIVNSITTCN